MDETKIEIDFLPQSKGQSIDTKNVTVETETKNQLTSEQQKLMKETLYVLGEKLNLLKKVRVKDLLNYDVEGLNFYIDGDEDNHLYNCWFSYDEKLKQISFYGISKDQEKIPNVYMRFPKKVVKDFGEKEYCGIWISKELFKHFGKEEVLENFYKQFLGYTMDYTKCFTVVKQSDEKLYTGKEGEEPFVIYHQKYLNRLFNGSSEYGGFHNKQLLKVVNKKCRELGFTLEGNGGMVNESEIREGIDPDKPLLLN